MTYFSRVFQKVLGLAWKQGAWLPFWAITVYYNTVHKNSKRCLTKCKKQRKASCWPAVAPGQFTRAEVALCTLLTRPATVWLLTVSKTEIPLPWSSFSAWWWSHPCSWWVSRGLRCDLLLWRQAWSVVGQAQWSWRRPVLKNRHGPSSDVSWKPNFLQCYF